MSARASLTPHRRASRLALHAVPIALTIALGVAASAGSNASLALFTNANEANAVLAAARIFEGERVTPAFQVTDRSSGTAVDASSGSAFAADGRHVVTRAWPTAFAASRYIEADFSSPLPAGLSVTGATLGMRVASDAGTGSVCLYAELRRASDGATLSAHGSAASPLGCTSGTAALAISVPLPAVTASSVANDLRLRVYARDSAAGALRVDQATISGATAYAAFSLYPLLTREAFDGQLEIIRWGLAGP
jgi:hypothetical protein